MKALTHRTFSIIIIVLLLIVPLSVCAHPGNTDGNGGHHVIGTDEYHYHHGYPAHQHPNGVCPYSEYYSNVTKPTSKNNDTLKYWIVGGLILGVFLAFYVSSKIRGKREDQAKRANAIIPDFKVWFSPTGTKYHSSSECICLRKTTKLQWATDTINTRSIYDKTPCSKCCYMEDGKVCAKSKVPPVPAAPPDATKKQGDVKMYPIRSSNLESVGYSGRTLLIHFKNGSTYRYADVPPEIVKGLFAAPSAGKYYNANIRDCYTCEYIN